MSSVGDFSLSDRFKISINSILSRFGVSHKTAIKIERSNFLVKISDGQDSIWTTSPHRWRRYKRGIKEKQKRLLDRYGYYELKPKSGVCIDVGANIGEVSIALSDRGNVVYAVEPEPLTLFCLLTNTEKIEKVRVSDHVFWNCDDVIRFYIDQIDADSSIIPNGQDVPSISKRTTTLDLFWEQYELNEVCFLKADCEGAEPELLEGGKNALKNVHSISIDAGAERKGRKTADECEQILKESGFSVRVKDLGEPDAIVMGQRG